MLDENRKQNEACAKDRDGRKKIKGKKYLYYPCREGKRTIDATRSEMRGKGAPRKLLMKRKKKKRVQDVFCRSSKKRKLAQVRGPGKEHV